MFSVSAPGSLMLLGEHAVLQNKLAIVAAVNKRIHIQLIPDATNSIKIIDAKLGNLEQNIKNLKIQAPFQFVLSAILLFKDRITTGFTLHITADFSSVMGLGSSAAVTAATVAVIANWLDHTPLDPKLVFTQAKQAILTIQGRGSCADLAASVYGGVLSYQLQPFEIIPLPLTPDLTAVYCGYKTPTVEVIALVNQAKQQQPELFANIFQAMHLCVQQAILAIKNADWPALGCLFTQHQAFQRALGTSNQLLDVLLSQLAAEPAIYGAKISGSGLGDCIIGLGTLAAPVFPKDVAQQQQGILQLTVSIDKQGLVYGHN